VQSSDACAEDGTRSREQDSSRILTISCCTCLISVAFKQAPRACELIALAVSRIPVPGIPVPRVSVTRIAVTRIAVPGVAISRIAIPRSVVGRITDSRNGCEWLGDLRSDLPEACHDRSGEHPDKQSVLNQVLPLALACEHTKLLKNLHANPLKTGKRVCRAPPKTIKRVMLKRAPAFGASRVPRSLSRPSCSVRCRSEKSGELAVSGPSRSIHASSQRRTATSAPRWPPAPSARTSISDWVHSSFRFRPSVIGERTSRRWFETAENYGGHGFTLGGHCSSCESVPSINPNGRDDTAGTFHASRR